MKLFICFLVVITPILAQIHVPVQWEGNYNPRSNHPLVDQPHTGYSQEPWGINYYDDYFGQPFKRAISSLFKPSSWLPIKPPSWIPNLMPDFNNILMRAKNLWAGMPFQFASTAINQICNAGIYTGFLKPNYVPQKDSLKLELYPKGYYGQDSTSARFAPEVNYHTNVTIFVTGWESASENSGSQNTVNILSNAYDQRGGTYFMIYDVAKEVTNLLHWSTLNTAQVGEALGQEIIGLVQNQGFAPQYIHVIGHGVGAHVAGVAGRHVSKVLGQQIARITGLDPSMICYDQKSGFANLQRGDAAFVDVIHSNNGVLGKKEAVGDVDFYPNGQLALPPGCLNVICAHLLAVRYYAESVIPGQESNFLAVRCNSISDYRNQKCRGQQNPMGYATPPNARGTYYLYTNELPPFGKNNNS